MPRLPAAPPDRNAVPVVDEWLWRSTRLYARAYGWFKDHTGRNLKGLGFLLRQVRSDRVFEARGFRWFFDHRIGSSYIRLVGDSYNEPETHALLGYLADRATGPLTFVDVGANIGELVIALAAHPRVARVIAFEPHPICVEVCRRNAALNQLRVDVRPLLVGDGSAQSFIIDPDYAHISAIRRGAGSVPPIATARLDDQLDGASACMLLIDVEGAELDVLRGAAAFIERQRPLVVFEYNALVQRALFTLADVRSQLGDGYDLYRLRPDGYLDRDLDDTWNCVAVHAASSFATLCRERAR